MRRHGKVSKKVDEEARNFKPKASITGRSVEVSYIPMQL